MRRVGFAENKTLIPAVYGIVALVFIFAYWLFQLGQTGGLLLDDVVNLNLLDDLDSLSDKDQLVQFLVLQGKNNALGRPVSLLTFAAQLDAWRQGDFAAFKLANICIHLANGLMLWLISLRIGRQFGLAERETHVASVFVLAFWLLHPINVSSVLYIVQRMAQLSTFFMLSAVLSYVYFRQRSSAKVGVKPLFWLSAFLVLIGILAIFSKENGVLIPVVLLVCEFSLFKRDSRSPLLRNWIRWCLILPTMLILLYLVFKAFNPNAQIRDFTVVERLMTEPRVILDYLGRIFFPHPRAFGLFYDDVEISRGLFSPFQTLPAILAVVGGFIAAFLLRFKLPALFFGVLWYFAGHLLESTTIMLEIGFEHRNYFPMTGLCLGVCFEVVRLCRDKVRPSIAISLSVLCVIFIAVLTFLEAKLWGNQLHLSAVWAKEKPDSERAQDLYAGILAQHGMLADSYAKFSASAKYFTHSSSSLSTTVVLTCLDAGLPKPDYAAVISRFKVARFSFAPISNIERIIKEKESGRCESISSLQVRNMIYALMNNPPYAKSEYLAHLYMLLGRAYALDRSLGPAVAFLSYSVQLQPRMDVAVHKVSWLISANAWDDARVALDEVRKISKRQPLDYLAFKKVIQQMEAVVSAHQSDSVNHMK